MPHITAIATSDAFSDKALYEYLLRMVSPDSVQILALLDMCQHYGWTYVSLVFSAGTYGENAASVVDRALRADSSGATTYSICLATSQKIFSDATSEDIAVILRTLMSEYSSARVVLLFLSGNHKWLFGNAVRETNVVGKFLWVAGDFLFSFASTSYTDVVDYALFPNHVADKIPAFVAVRDSLTPSDIVGDPWFNAYWERLYHCSFIESVNTTLCPSNVTFTTANCPYYWPMISRIYDAVHVFGNAIHKLIVDRCPEAFAHKKLLADCIDGEDLLKYLYKTDLHGAIGKIQFDSSGNMRENLTINQFQSGSIVEVGFWNVDNKEVYIDNETISWSIFQTDNTSSTAAVPTSVCSLPCQDNLYL